MTLLLPLLAACLPYTASLKGGFVFDDHALIQEMPSRLDMSMGGTGLWGDLLATGYYRPLLQVSLALDNLLGSGNPQAFHLTNLLLHIALVLAAWLLFLRLSGRWDLATVAATLFAVHPVHVEAVAWISGRGDLLAPLLGLCGWLALIQGGWLPGRRLASHGASSVPWLMAAAALWLAAILSKESAVALPLMAWWSAAVSTDHQHAGGKRRTFAFPPWFTAPAVALGTALALRLMVLGSIRGPWPADPLANPAAGLGSGDRLATAGFGLLQTWHLLAWPWPLRADYGRPVVQAMEMGSIPGLLGIVALSAAVALLVLGWWWRRRLSPWARPILLGAGLALLAWLPVSSLGPLPDSLLAERYLVLPSLGWSLMVAAAVLGPGHRRLWHWLTATIVVAAWTGIVLARVPVWHDDDRLFAAEQALSPHSYKIDYFAGLMAFKAKKDREAGRSFGDCLATAPTFSLCHEGRARVELRRRRLVEAAAAGRAALRHAPPYPLLAARYRVLLAEILWEQGHEDAAEPLLRAAAAMDPATATAPRRLGDLLQSSGRPGAAVAAYRQALARDPLEPVARFNLAMALLGDGQERAAEEVLTGLAARADAPAAVFYHLGVLADGQGQTARARGHLERFIPTAQDPLRRADALRRLERLATEPLTQPVETPEPR
ncbi:MAG: tetratricopeptide repeat protein [Acidobacteria bacterium]|nr:tetratricopeptide repeat protein [Acidobacteriota bacterium]